MFPKTGLTVCLRSEIFSFYAAIYRSLPFDKFVQRVSEDKHSEFFISEVSIEN
jgi:hypothetical protein